ncbi:hypothetical protein MSAN_02068100 [Mycena sanguinolenta]|uniref:DUF6699 domain-containing protein n=1 Tax=Mycena sanguinolenta TaxID=230812 RepID=A0A8H7CMS8_9AGAR|nr:hypothetical protein MSAN_02068100 [Mycena sanguinolenta]
MTKQVRFSNTNIMYSPIPWSPSPGASTSALPPTPSIAAVLQLPEPPVEETTSSAAQTEQSYHFPSPAPIVYSPWPSAASLCMSPRPNSMHLPYRAQIHSLLSFTPFGPPNVYYNLSHPLHTINSQLTPSFLNSAIFPPQPALTVLCRHISWPISVSPSQPTGFVSVLDVFTSVYTSLRLAVLRTEYETLPSDDARRSVDNAYFARCTLVADEEERKIEALKGVKRIDFLAGKTCFLGLSGPLEGAHVWELNVA